MNETSGTNATDLAGGNDNAFYEGGYTLNQPGGLGADPDPAVALNGTSGRVRTGSSRRLGSATGVTVEALVNPVNLTPSSQAIARKQGQYLVRLDNAGRLIFRLWKNGAVTELLSPPGVVAAGAWNHVAATYDGTTMRVYVNGTERAQRSLNGPVDDPNTRLYMGSSDGYDYLRARLDEVVTYPRAVSAEPHRGPCRPSGRRRGPAHGHPARTGRRQRHGRDSELRRIRGNGGHGPERDHGSGLRGLDGVGPSGSDGDRRRPGLRGVLDPRRASSRPARTRHRLRRPTRPTTSGISPAKTFQVNAEADPSLLVAGDIAGCDSAGDTATAALLDGLPGTVVPAGDLAYEDGTPAQFEQCYDPTWGRHKARTQAGNRGSRVPHAGRRRVLRLLGRCRWGSGGGLLQLRPRLVARRHPQRGVRRAPRRLPGGLAPDRLARAGPGREPSAAARRSSCTRRSSARATSTGSVFDMYPFWQALYDAGAEFVVSGDDHTYERFAPQTPDGVLDQEHGIQQFVAGMGGRSHYGFNAPMPNSQARNANTYGILQLQLHSDSYDFNFVPEAGGTFTDSGLEQLPRRSPAGSQSHLPGCRRGAQLRDSLSRGHRRRGPGGRFRGHGQHLLWHQRGGYARRDDRGDGCR